jgi:PAS domain S-box-containing protein
MEETWEKYREKIIGLGENSSRKSYYPELQEKIDQLETSQHNLETILNSISDGIVIHDKNGKILSLNKQSEKIFNITEEVREQYTILDISSELMDKNELFSIWEKVLQGKPQMIEWVIRKIHSQEEVNVHVSINRTKWNNEMVMVAVIRDFSERKKYEQELIVARQKAEESDRLKTAFLANLSHEIRTPMNAILGFSELLHQPDLPPKSRDTYINIIHDRGKHLLSIINDIIEMSQIQAGQISLKLTLINIDACLENLYNSLKVTIPSGKEIDFRIIKPTSPSQTITDEVKLCQILTNLISNAIKYTEKGFVEFGYKFVGNTFIEFKVRDSGAGIDKKYHNMIFDRFNRIDSDLTIKEGGFGIGLAISKAYVEMLGGEIHLESEIGKGSTFKFLLPCIISENKDSKIEQKSGKSLT